MDKQSAFSHPLDTPVSSGLRFLVEVIAWVAGPWAAAEQSIWLVAPVLVILVGLPAVFSARGDKRRVVVATPGPLRVAIEAGLSAVAIVAPWIVWPVWLAIPATVIVVAALAVGIPRTKWLLYGAPPLIT